LACGCLALRCRRVGLTQALLLQRAAKVIQQALPGCPIVAGHQLQLQGGLEGALGQGAQAQLERGLTQQGEAVGIDSIATSQRIANHLAREQSLQQQIERGPLDLE
jgi:hypothetical protein